MFKWLPYLLYSSYSIRMQNKRDRHVSHGAEGNPLFLVLLGPLSIKLLSGIAIIIFTSIAYFFFGSYKDKFVYFTWLIGMLLIGLLILSIIQLLLNVSLVKRVREQLNSDHIKGR